MHTSMNGKPIAFVDLNPMWTPHGNPERIASGDGVALVLSATHHGDHDQFWIVLMREGKEAERLNAGAVNRIVWA